MSASLHKQKKGSWLRFYLFFTVGCAVFSYVYEQFSHGVVSRFMVWLFAVPLVLGLLPCLFCRRQRMPGPGRFWHDGVLVLTLGCCLSGVLEIYGTSSVFTQYYFYAGTALLVADLMRRCLPLTADGR